MVRENQVREGNRAKELFEVKAMTCKGLQQVRFCAGYVLSSQCDPLLRAPLLRDAIVSYGRAFSSAELQGCQRECQLSEALIPNALLCTHRKLLKQREDILYSIDGWDLRPGSSGDISPSATVVNLAQKAAQGKAQTHRVATLAAPVKELAGWLKQLSDALLMILLPELKRLEKAVERQVSSATCLAGICLENQAACGKDNDIVH